ncbi:response regulator [Asticcacaulis solisilvae]|uniref:response regulator n=1 Tax=Asticcacaulis solisilvae TaxID=1217274 RepID=UPI003FD7EA51
MADDVLRILLVEDNPGDVMSLQRSFRRIAPDAEITVARDAEAAVHELAEAPHGTFGLLLLDINLPRMSGIELLRRLKSESWLSNTPMLLLTTSEAPFDVKTGYASGADGYLVKPFDPQGYDRLVRFLINTWNGDILDDADDYRGIVVAPPAG